MTSTPVNFSKVFAAPAAPPAPANQAREESWRMMSCADTARFIRIALKEAFPRTKFSVRSSVYSMGASITIRWVDGPNTKQVDAVAKQFQGATFDGMTDYKGGVLSRFRGELVRFGADFVFTERSYTAARIRGAVMGIEFDSEGQFDWETIKIVEREDGTAYVAGDRPLILSGRYAGDNLAQAVRSYLVKRSWEITRACPTAKAVEFVRSY